VLVDVAIIEPPSDTLSRLRNASWYSNSQERTLDALLRHWAMLRLIPRHPRRVDTGRIRDELERQGYAITLRSIQRDLNKLSAVLPLCCDQSKPQGWWWQADADLLEIPGLDPQAALVFKMAEQHLKQVLPASTLDSLRPWFRAANGVLDALPDGVGGWMNKVRILPSGPPLIPPSINPDVQSAIYQGLFENRRMALCYKPRGAVAAKAYEINPMAVVQRGYSIYIVCTCGNDSNPKLFLMHRIESATLLDDLANCPAGFDVDAYIAEGELGYRLGPPIKLVADFEAGAARVFHETPIAIDQSIAERPNGVVRLTATVADTWELRAWLRGFGRSIEVLSPKALLDDDPQPPRRNA
jgi:predicted DNA-binding transcriptional regulator YafY